MLSILFLVLKKKRGKEWTFQYYFAYSQQFRSQQEILNISIVLRSHLVYDLICLRQISDAPCLQLVPSHEHGMKLFHHLVHKIKLVMLVLYIVLGAFVVGGGIILSVENLTPRNNRI